MALAFSFSCRGGSLLPQCSAFPAACAWIFLVIPNTVVALLVGANSVASAPGGHKSHSARLPWKVLAWKVLCHVGITGKVVDVKIPKEEGEGRASSAGCPE